MFNGKHILVGIGGGIAVYRVAELVRMLQKAGADVRCVMTASAQEFVTPLTFEALTGNQVHTQLFDLTRERNMGHIALARWADAILIAPATAGLLARMAHGMADDLLSTIMLVNKAPVLLAPAMNASMWASAATQNNIASLTSRGMHMVGPVCGELACGEQGMGRLAEPQHIQSALLPLLTAPCLSGQRWVINAGPTREAWDDVRLLTNRASGTLGTLLAEQAVIRGAEVHLIAGPGTPDSHPKILRTDVESAQDMLTACTQQAAGADLFIGTAAISDFRISAPVHGKIKRGDTATMQLALTANPDIIATIATMTRRPSRVIAFAAESCDHITHARAKLHRKHVDAIIANDIANMGNTNMAPNTTHTAGWWIDSTDERPLQAGNKRDFAQQIIQQIIQHPQKSS